MIDLDLAMASIAQWGKADGLLHVTEFEGYRKNADGEDAKLKIRVLDNRQKGSPVRYHVEVTDEYGRCATGNPDPDVDLAVSGVHWGNLDSPLKPVQGSSPCAPI